MKITLKMVYDELILIRGDLRMLPVVKWAAFLALTISVGSILAR